MGGGGLDLWQQLLRVHVGLLYRVADPVVRVADDEQPVLAVDQHAAAAAQDALPAAFDVLAREHDLVVRADEHGGQRQRAAQDQPVREQRHGRVHERGGHVYPTLDVVRQIAHALNTFAVTLWSGVGRRYRPGVGRRGQVFIFGPPDMLILDCIFFNNLL